MTIVERVLNFYRKCPFLQYQLVLLTLVPWNVPHLQRIYMHLNQKTKQLTYVI